MITNENSVCCQRMGVDPPAGNAFSYFFHQILFPILHSFAFCTHLKSRGSFAVFFSHNLSNCSRRPSSLLSFSDKHSFSRPVSPFVAKNTGKFSISLHPAYVVVPTSIVRYIYLHKPQQISRFTARIFITVVIFQSPFCFLFSPTAHSFHSNWKSATVQILTSPTISSPLYLHPSPPYRPYFAFCHPLTPKAQSQFASC